MFNDYSEVDFERSLNPRLSLGVSYAFQNQSPGLRRVRSTVPDDCEVLEPTDPGGCSEAAARAGTVDNHNVEVDALFKWAGFSAISEFMWRDGTRNAGTDGNGDPVRYVEPARDGYGWMIQAGYLIPELPLEFSARYSMVRGQGKLTNLIYVDDQDGYTSLEDRDGLGVGMSWYFAQHPFKLQADYLRLWQGDIGGTDVLNSLRIQLQGSL